MCGRTDVLMIVNWYMDGKIDIDNLITANIKIDDINKGLAEMHNNY